MRGRLDGPLPEECDVGAVEDMDLRVVADNDAVDSDINDEGRLGVTHRGEGPKGALRADFLSKNGVDTCVADPRGELNGLRTVRRMAIREGGAVSLRRWPDTTPCYTPRHKGCHRLERRTRRNETRGGEASDGLPSEVYALKHIEEEHGLNTGRRRPSGGDGGKTNGRNGVPHSGDGSGGEGGKPIAAIQNNRLDVLTEGERRRKARRRGRGLRMRIE